MSNLSLWQAVEKTPVEHTKPITGKTYKGTSPKPHYLIHKATETFGPCGIGWGFTVEERVENGAVIEDGFCEKMHVAKVRVWYKWNGERGEVEHIGGTMFSGRYSSGKVFTDEDAPKKSVTDALVKALSMIGFAGDIFMGRYDDSKYVNDLKDEARGAPTPQRQEAAKPKPAANDALTDDRQATIADSLIGAMEFSRSVADLKAWKKDEAQHIRTLTGRHMDRVAAAYKAREAELMADEPANMLEAG